MDKFINKVIQGDCLEVMKGIPDKSIDMVLTSPPYDNLRDYKGYIFNFEGIAQEIYRVLKDGGVCVWVVGDATIKGSETGTSFKQALYFKEIGFNLHDTMIYLKENLAFPDKNRYYQGFEYMFVFSKGIPKTFNPIKDKINKSFGRSMKGSTQRLRNGETIPFKNQARIIPQNSTRFNYWFLYNSKRGIETKHPAIFPEKLAEDHIISWSNEGDIILDPMAGSGTTLKMAKKNNRNYIGIEIAEEYIKIAESRIKSVETNLL
jgi:DNA modification methylase